MNEFEQFLGVVQNGQFLGLEPQRGLVKLTRIQRQAAVAPEAELVPLEEYEGKVILVAGYLNGDWIYEAHVVDQAGPILTAVVQKVFAQ